MTMLQVGVTVLFHTVSPQHNDDEVMYHKVNVLGTKAVLDACFELSVPVLVYTSSSGVVWSGEALSGVTEDEAPIPEKGLEPYSATKAIGETMVRDLPLSDRDDAG